MLVFLEFLDPRVERIVRGIGVEGELIYDFGVLVGQIVYPTAETSFIPDKLRLRKILFGILLDVAKVAPF